MLINIAYLTILGVIGLVITSRRIGQVLLK
jgi:hypothetical protein